MVKRDSERNHEYSEKVFGELEIFDIQGLLKEDDTYKCGVEAYQVRNFDLINFDLLNQEEEFVKYLFCEKLNIPYYLIVTAEDIGAYKIFNTVCIHNNVDYELLYTFKKETFLKWWRHHQSFEQKKDMYDAQSRLNNSIIDRDLFENSLAWGVNVDGFIMDDASGDIKAIIEKRICTYKPPSYSVTNYDPDRYFHGTRSRSGDYPSWKILFDLSRETDTPLFLLTFDTSSRQVVGASRIMDIDQRNGIIYKDGVRPSQNLFQNNLNGLKSWLEINS